MTYKKFCAAAVMALGLLSTARAEQGVLLSSGFTDFTTWSLYGNATAYNDTPGNGFTYSNLQLTAPGVGGSAGAGFSPNALVLDFNQSFTFDFNFFIAGNALRGDGLTFTLATAPGFGGAGSGLGYDGLPDSSVAFAVDTFHFDGEPVSPSLQILQNGSVQPLAFTETGLGDAIRDTSFQFRGTVSFAPSGLGDQQGTLTGSILHANLGSFSVSAAVDLSTLGLTVNDPQPGDPVLHSVYFGFTGGNGLAEDGHFITSAVVAVPEPSTYAMLLTGIALLGWVARRRLRTAGLV